MSKNLNPLLEYISIGKTYKTLEKSAKNATKRSNLAKEITKSRSKIKPRDWYVKGKNGVTRNMGPVERNEEVFYDTLVNNQGKLRSQWK